jgi:Cadherin domain
MNWEVDCCPVSAASTVSYINSLVTGASVALNSQANVAYIVAGPGYEALNIGSSGINLLGDAYKSLNNVPVANQLVATANLNGSTPTITGRTTMGFKYGGSSLNAGAGTLTGMGDINIWYDGLEPTTAVSANVFNFLTKYLTPSPVCAMDTDNDGIPNTLDLDSDGDGCPDAIEGGATFATTDLVTSTMAGGNSGAGYTGTSTSLVSQNLGNTVGNTATTMGVPTIATTGQTVGTSQNKLTQDPNCVLCVAGTTAPSVSATTLSNTCPTTTVDLNSLHTGTIPNGARLRWHTVATNPTVADSVATPSVLATAGTYYAYYFDAIANCYSPASVAVTVTINTAPAAPTTTVTQPTCAIATGTITVTAPTSGVTYSFDNGTTFQAAATSNALATGTYQVKVKNSTSNCVSTATATIINAQPASPVISSVAKTDASLSSCPALNDGTITITATGANLQYSKDNGATYQASNSFTGLVAGSYTIKVKDNLSTCEVAYTSNPVVLTAPTCVTCPIPSVGGTTTTTTPNFCGATNGGTVTLSGQTGAIIKWQTSTTGGTSWTDIVNTTTSLSFTNAVNNQQYRAVVNNAGSCADANSTATTITVSTPPAAPTTTVSQPTCAIATGTITVTAPTSGVTYSFDNGTTFQAAATSNALATGAYSVKVKDDVSGCVSTATATTINAQPASVTIINVSKGDPSVLSCPALNNGTISVTATGANLMYSIDNGATYQASNAFTGLVAGSYAVKVKDNVTGCDVAYPSNPVILAAPTCNQYPNITSSLTATTPENVLPTTTVYTVTATDPDAGQTQTFSFETGGADNGKFTIDPNTGEVKFIASPDFEAPTDANGDNVYEIRVKVCDNGTPQYCDIKTVLITVTDVAECAIASVGGTTAFMGGTVCNTANSGVITLTGKTGNVVKWQTSTNGGTSWTDIANTTTTLNFTFANAVNNQQYRAVVNNSGSCVDAFSTATAITTSAAACSANCDVPKPIVTGH